MNNYTASSWLQLAKNATWHVRRKLKLNEPLKEKPWSFTWLEWCATPDPIGAVAGWDCVASSTDACGDNSLVLLSWAWTLPGKPAIGWYWGYCVWPTTGWLNCPANWPGAPAPEPSVGGTDICMMAGSLGSDNALFTTRISLMSEPRNKM